jgi:hypothetical protein
MKSGGWRAKNEKEVRSTDQEKKWGLRTLIDLK